MRPYSSATFPQGIHRIEDRLQPRLQRGLGRLSGLAISVSVLRSAALRVPGSSGSSKGLVARRARCEAGGIRLARRVGLAARRGLAQGSGWTRSAAAEAPGRRHREERRRGGARVPRPRHRRDSDIELYIIYLIGPCIQAGRAGLSARRRPSLRRFRRPGRSPRSGPVASRRTRRRPTPPPGPRPPRAAAAPAPRRPAAPRATASRGSRRPGSRSTGCSRRRRTRDRVVQVLVVQDVDDPLGDQRGRGLRGRPRSRSPGPASPATVT